MLASADPGRRPSCEAETPRFLSKAPAPRGSGILLSFARSLRGHRGVHIPAASPPAPSQRVVASGAANSGLVGCLSPARCLCDRGITLGRNSADPRQAQTSLVSDRRCPFASGRRPQAARVSNPGDPRPSLPGVPGGAVSSEWCAGWVRETVSPGIPGPSLPDALPCCDCDCRFCSGGPPLRDRDIASCMPWLPTRGYTTPRCSPMYCCRTDYGIRFGRAGGRPPGREGRGSSSELTWRAGVFPQPQGAERVGRYEVV